LGNARAAFRAIASSRASPTSAEALIAILPRSGWKSKRELSEAIWYRNDHFEHSGSPCMVSGFDHDFVVLDGLLLAHSTGFMYDSTQLFFGCQSLSR
jgi:hypothetical protein